MFNSGPRNIPPQIFGQSKVPNQTKRVPTGQRLLMTNQLANALSLKSDKTLVAAKRISEAELSNINVISVAILAQVQSSASQLHHFIFNSNGIKAPDSRGWAGKD